jgi:hypothetical protein
LAWLGVGVRPTVGRNPYPNTAGGGIQGPRCSIDIRHRDHVGVRFSNPSNRMSPCNRSFSLARHCPPLAIDSMCLLSNDADLEFGFEVPRRVAVVARACRDGRGPNPILPVQKKSSSEAATLRRPRQGLRLAMRVRAVTRARSYASPTPAPCVDVDYQRPVQAGRRFSTKARGPSR